MRVLTILTFLGLLILGTPDPGPSVLSLLNVRFLEGVTFNFTGSAVTALNPGQSVVVVRNTNAFTARYGAGLSIAGQYVGSLDNGGERLRLVDATGEEILDFSYNNSWYPITDGYGFSLVIRDEAAPFYTWGDKASWRPSGQLNGSPGTGNGTAPNIASIRPRSPRSSARRRSSASVSFVTRFFE